MHYCSHDYHYAIVDVFEHVAKKKKISVKQVTDGVFLNGFEPLVIEVYEELHKRAPENDGVIYCCPKCGSYDLVSEEIAQSRGYECSMQ
jgi:hypothetical protein